MTGYYLQECYSSGQRLFEEVDLSGEDLRRFNLPNLTFDFCQLDGAISRGGLFFYNLLLCTHTRNTKQQIIV